MKKQQGDQFQTEIISLMEKQIRIRRADTVGYFL
jgi:hypothetical protein